MANLRKFLGLAGVALVYTGLAYGQASCSASGVPVLIRGESTNDFTGDLLLKCTNTNLSGIVGASTMNVQVFASTGVTFTSKVLDTTTGLSEAVAWTPAAGKNTNNTPALYAPGFAALGT